MRKTMAGKLNLETINMGNPTEVEEYYILLRQPVDVIRKKQITDAIDARKIRSVVLQEC